MRDETLQQHTAAAQRGGSSSSAVAAGNGAANAIFGRRGQKEFVSRSPFIQIHPQADQRC